jgi:Phage capsid family
MTRQELQAVARRFGTADAARSEVRRIDAELDAVQAKIPGALASEARQLEKRGGLLLAEKADAESAAEYLEAKAKFPVNEDNARGVGGPKTWPALRGEMFSELVYRPDSTTDGGERVSFFADMVTQAQSPGAAERLRRNQAEGLDYLQRTGDITTVNPGMDGFVPPVYLQQFMADFPRAGRPFADAIGSQPLVDYGMTLTIPRLTTSALTGVQAAEANPVTEQDPDSDTITSPVATIAGQVDASRQAIERTLPNADAVILNDLLADYNKQLDAQLLTGLGSSGQLRGLTHASGSTGSVTYTDGSPTGLKLIKKIANAASTVATTRFLEADTLLIHPRRGAYLASEFDATNPVLPAGSTVGRAVGTQVRGSANDVLGLGVVLDPNLAVNGGAGTNQDDAWVLRVQDMLLFESGVRMFRFQEVLSGTLQIRVQLYGYAAAFLDRWPSSICKISGTGLVTPSWT